VNTVPNVRILVYIRAQELERVYPIRGVDLGVYDIVAVILAQTRYLILLNYKI
jgi:hypothetical protein